MTKKFPSALWCSVMAILVCSAVSGCKQHSTSSGLVPVTLQTDWYPQPEHGGFYDALIKGYYKDEGLDVRIQPGGPYVNAEQQVAADVAQFGMGSSDRILEGISQGQSLVAVAATMQHDPQAIMMHKDSPVHTFSDLEGHAIAVKPSSTWFRYLVNRYHLKNVREVPATYSVANFLQDPTYIQQIFVTSEPFFARQAGVDIRTMLISDTGYNPYRVIFTTQSFAKQHPEVVARFVRASLRGWRDYMNDPTVTNATISRLNPAMNAEQMKFTWAALKDGHFITGEDPSGTQLGQFDTERWSAMYRQLTELQMIQKPFDPATAYTLQFLQTK